LSTPKFTIRWSSPVERTLAPYAWREKPQLSPWLAASFIKNARNSGGYAKGESAAALQRQREATMAGKVMPIFIGVLR
jgi:hypothetical protein